MKLSRLYAGLLGAVAIVGAIALAHAASLTAQVHTEVIGTYTGTNDLGSPTFGLTSTGQGTIALASGTGSGQANALFADSRSLSASATEQLDLFGSLVDPLGGTLSFATIKVLKVCALSTNTNDVNVGGASSGTFTGPFSVSTAKVTVRPGGCVQFIAPQTGWTVTNSTGDKLELGNGGGTTSVTYTIVIAGTQ